MSQRGDEEENPLENQEAPDEAEAGQRVGDENSSNVRNGYGGQGQSRVWGRGEGGDLALENDICAYSHRGS